MIKYPKIESKQLGFTLIELMIVTFMVAVIATIAIPSYQKYIIQNAEKAAQAEIKQLASQLDRWRAARLTYRNFTPRLGEDVCGVGNGDYCYKDTNNTTVYLPLGSDDTNFKYQLTIVDGSDSTSSLVDSSGGSTVNVLVGQSWKIFAEPSDQGLLENAHKFMLTNTGVQCMTKDESIDISSSDCGNNYTSKSW